MNRNIDKKKTKQVVVSIGLHTSLRIEAAERGMTLRGLIEHKLGWKTEINSIDTDEKGI